jgi:hypothetical protein
MGATGMGATGMGVNCHEYGQIDVKVTEEGNATMYLSVQGRAAAGLSKGALALHSVDGETPFVIASTVSGVNVLAPHGHNVTLSNVDNANHVTVGDNHVTISGMIRVDKRNSMVRIEAEKGIVMDSNTVSLTGNNTELHFGRNGTIAAERHLDVTSDAVVIAGKKLVRIESDDDIILSSQTVTVHSTLDVMHFNTTEGSQEGFLLTSNSTLKISSDELTMHSKESVKIDAAVITLSGDEVNIGDFLTTTKSSVAIANSFVANITGTFVDSSIENPLTVSVNGGYVTVLSEDSGMMIRGNGKGVISMFDYTPDKTSPSRSNNHKSSLVIDTTTAASDSLDASIVLRSPSSTFGALLFEDSESVGGRIGFYHGTPVVGKDKHLSINVGDAGEVVRVTENGFLGIGNRGCKAGAECKIKAPLHVRNTHFTSPADDVTSSVGVLLENKRNTLHLSGEAAGNDAHVNGIVMGSQQYSGSSSYWIMSQRSKGSVKGDKGFGSNSFVVGWTDRVSDVAGETSLTGIAHGLDDLTSGESSFNNVMTLRDSGNVGLGCNNPSSRLAVGGDVESADLITFADASSISSKGGMQPGVAIGFVNEMAVYKCEFTAPTGSGGGGDSWQGLKGRKDYCLVADEVELVDKGFVKVDGSGKKGLKLRPMVAVLVAGLQDVSKEAAGVEERLVAEEEKMDGVRKNVTMVDKFASQIEVEVGLLKTGVKDNNRTAIGMFAEKDREIIELKNEVEAAKMMAKNEGDLRKVLEEQVEGLTSVVKSLRKDLEVFGEEFQSLKTSLSSDGENGGRPNDETGWFLSLIDEKENTFRADQGSNPVTDKMLDAIRAKWRVEAYEALRRRRQDMDFLKKQSP